MFFLGAGVLKKIVCSAGPRYDVECGVPISVVEKWVRPNLCVPQIPILLEQKGTAMSLS